MCRNIRLLDPVGGYLTIDEPQRFRDRKTDSASGIVLGKVLATSCLECTIDEVSSGNFLKDKAGEVVIRDNLPYDSIIGFCYDPGTYPRLGDDHKKVVRIWYIARADAHPL